MTLWRPLCLASPCSRQGPSHHKREEGDGLLVAGVAGTGFCAFEKMTLNGTHLETSLVPVMSAEASAEVACFSQPRAPVAGLDLDRVRLMGILNVTPDSFSDGGAYLALERAVEQGLRLLSDGADIIDVGGESTRPGAAVVSVEEELSRVIPVIEALRAETSAVISIDTRKAEVMRRAVEAGASMINDVSALSFDALSLKVAAALNVPVVLMHAQGLPQTMQDNPTYDHVLFEVYDYLSQRVEAALSAGIKKEHILVDPGIGFGKDLPDNLQLMAGLSVFHGLQVPLLLGCSRKRFIGALSDHALENERLAGSVAGALQGAVQGVHIVRVHDVKETRQALNVWFGLGSDVGD